MTILSKAVDALGEVDQLNTIADALNTVINADNALDVTSAERKLEAETSTEVITVVFAVKKIL